MKRAPMGKCPTCGAELAERLLKSSEFRCPSTQRPRPVVVVVDLSIDAILDRLAMRLGGVA